MQFSTTIRFALGHPLSKDAMRKTILATYNFIWGIISAEGDTDLPPQEDPFVFNQHHGASIVASSIGGHKLTWGLVKGAVLGLYNALYLKGMYKTASFELWDGSQGKVGEGFLRMNFFAAALNKTNIITTSDGGLTA